MGTKFETSSSWVLMELPCVAVFTWIYFQGVRAGQLIPFLLFIVWQLHYVQRTFVYPALMHPRGTPLPVSVIGMGFTFNALNALLNGIALTHLSPGYSADWLVDPRFIFGVAIFSIGFSVNVHSDHILRSLRKTDETGYKIPYGGFFRWISSPNYFGEIMEWCGWTLASWSLAGGAFACFTFANLAPRAWAHHKWYRENFKEYPQSRKALIPGLI